MTVVSAHGIGGSVQVRPGDAFGISQMELVYAGPEKNLALCFGVKPGGTGDFDNGAGLIPGSWAAGSFKTTAGKEHLLTINFPGMISFPMPYPGSHKAINGKFYTINWGTFDTWVWVTDLDKVSALGVALYDERAILLMDTDAGAGEIVQ